MGGRRAATTLDPSGPRQVARHILGDRRFRSSPTPRPLRKPLDWIGDRLRGFVDWIGRGLSHIPLVVVLMLVSAIVVLVILFIVSRVSARRGGVDARVRSAATADATEDPGELERAAELAEREGRLDEAVRLRFRAGLLRLGDRGAIRYRPSVTTTEVRHVLGSETFDELAESFDAIAYGGRDAAPPDVEAARREWPRVVSGSKPPR